MIKTKVNKLSLSGMEKDVLDFLMKEQGLSRYEISKHLNENAGAIARAVNRLLNKRYVVEGKNIKTTIGRPKLPLLLNSNIGYIIGFDIEATNVRGVVIDFGLKIISRLRYPLKLGCSSDSLLETMIKMYNDLLNNLKSNKILGVGLAIPGPYTPAGKITFYTENPLWSDFSIKDSLEKKIHQQIFIERNISAIVMGEKWFEFHGKIDNLICMIIRPGISAPFILNDFLYYEESGKTRGIGHMKIYSDGDICECGQKGCLRLYVSGRELIKKFRIIKPDKDVNTLSDIAQMSINGDEKAIEIISNAGKSLGIAIGHMINTLGIRQIIINSDLNESGEIFLGPIKKEVANSIPRDEDNEELSQVKFSNLDGYAGALGVASMAIQKVCGIG